MKKIWTLMAAVGASLLLILLALYHSNSESKSGFLTEVTTIEIPETTPFNRLEVFSIDTSLKTPEELDPPIFYRVVEDIELSKKDRDCILRNIFHEARGEPIEGKLAVAQVTFNRLRDGRWGKTICRVVFAKSQFSWTLDPKKRDAKPGGPMWRESKEVLEMYLSGVRVAGLDNSTHFHATWMERKPGWAHKKRELTTIGQHTFYASLR